jgi:hypothetical protein
LCNQPGEEGIMGALNFALVLFTFHLIEIILKTP